MNVPTYINKMFTIIVVNYNNYSLIKKIGYNINIELGNK